MIIIGFRQIIEIYYRLIINKHYNLNYNKYFSEGYDSNKIIEDYHSHNTIRLSESELIALLNSIGYK